MKPQLTDLESTNLYVSVKRKFINIASRERAHGEFFYFTEIDELESAIALLNRMLDTWRDELALKPVTYDEDET